MLVSYQGERGAYSEEAIFEFFDTPSPSPSSTFGEAIEKLREGNVDRAVLPVYNTLGGPVEEAQRALKLPGLIVKGEFYFRIEHHLLALPGVKLNEIERVISHPQALAQCEQGLNTLSASAHKAEDTAGSAKRIRAEELNKTAALASQRAGTLYDLTSLRANMEDNSRNYTRFKVLARR